MSIFIAHSHNLPDLQQIELQLTHQLWVHVWYWDCRNQEACRNHNDSQTNESENFFLNDWNVVCWLKCFNNSFITLWTNSQLILKLKTT